jgi:hypothetical protein
LVVVPRGDKMKNEMNKGQKMIIQESYE